MTNAKGLVRLVNDTAQRRLVTNLNRHTVLRRFVQSARVAAAGAAVGSVGIVACAPKDGTARQSESVTSQGALPTRNAGLAFYDDSDDTKDIWVSLADRQTSSDTFAKGCYSQPAVWNVPVRVGPTPSQLKDCWEGDAIPAGLPSGIWATGEIHSPTVARLTHAWVILYTATKATTSQQCIGAASGAHPAGPFPFHSNQEVYCPPSGGSASDPELYYDRQVNQWFLLWAEDVGACDSRIMIQQLDPSSVTLTGSPRELLSSADPNVRFSEIPSTVCNGHPRRRIESPAMVRSDPADPANPTTTSNLWLLFSANDRASNNYATGWAVCGTQSPAAGSACQVNTGIASSEFRPLWGDPGRIASISGVNAAPILDWPPLPGLGGLSLAVKSPTSPSPQPVYAAAQMLFGPAPGELIFRFDKSGPRPALLEADPVSWYGAPNTFGRPGTPGNAIYPTDSAGFTTPSGQPVSSRPVNGFAWSDPGLFGLFNEVSTDGTLFTGAKSNVSNNVVPSANVTRLGAFDPKTSRWQNIPILTSTGAQSISSNTSPFWSVAQPALPEPMNAGGFVADIQALENNAVAFVISAGFPAAYWGFFGNPGPVDTNAGVWPTFGIATKIGEQWQVLSQNQWTGAQLRALPGSNAALAQQICPENPGVLPAGESDCQALNEIAAMPRSKDLIITQYLSNDGGLAALHYAPIAGSSPVRYSIQWTGSFRYPRANLTNNANPRRAIIADIKEIQVDRSSAVNDERFVISFDLSFADGNNNPPPPNVIQEFSYHANQTDLNLRITPTSPPILGYASARYDKDGNLWAKGTAEIGIYAKDPTTGRKISTSACGFDPNNTEFQYFTGIDWGKACAPDYVIRQPETLYWDHNELFPPPDRPPALVRSFGPMEMTEHPTDNIMVAMNIGGFNSDPSQLLPIRYSGAGAAMKFDIGNVTDTGLGFFAPLQWKGLRPGSFDRNGRMWFVVDHVGGGANPPPHWVGAADVAQLFDPPPVVLAATTDMPTVTVQAENIAATSTKTCTYTNSCTRNSAGSLVVDPAVLVQTSSREDPTAVAGTGAGTELVTDSGGVGHKAGRADYKVYVPVTGNYKISYFVKASGAAGGNIVLVVDPGPNQSPPIGTTVDSTSWGLVANDTLIQLSQGVHTLALTPPASTAAAQWHLDYFSLTRQP